MRLTAATAFVLAMGLGSAASAANLIANGDFSSVSPTVAALQGAGFSGAEIGDDYKYHQALTGWTSGIGGGSAFNLFPVPKLPPPTRVAKVAPSKSPMRA